MVINNSHKLHVTLISLHKCSPYIYTGLVYIQSRQRGDTSTPQLLRPTALAHMLTLQCLYSLTPRALPSQKGMIIDQFCFNAHIIKSFIYLKALHAGRRRRMRNCIPCPSSRHITIAIKLSHPTTTMTALFTSSFPRLFFC